MYLCVCKWSANLRYLGVDMTVCGDIWAEVSHVEEGLRLCMH